MTASLRDNPHLDALVRLFYSSPELLGTFEEASAEEMPDDYRLLLAHHQHMTVTVEAYHRSPVDVRVLDTLTSGNRYARKILLARQSDGRVVQFGIMRVNFAYLGDEIRREIEGQRLPLGRILVEHNVLRELFLKRLWKVEAGEELSALFGVAPPITTYGRTAMIECNGEPAIEVLEIVTPVQIA